MPVDCAVASVVLDAERKEVRRNWTKISVSGEESMIAARMDVMIAPWGSAIEADAMAPAPPLWKR